MDLSIDKTYNKIVNRQYLKDLATCEFLSSLYMSYKPQPNSGKDFNLLLTANLFRK